MPAEIKCPTCQQPLTQVGKHWVCPEHGQISPRSSRGDEAQTSSATVAEHHRPGLAPLLHTVQGLDNSNDTANILTG